MTLSLMLRVYILFFSVTVFAESTQENVCDVEGCSPVFEKRPSLPELNSLDESNLSIIERIGTDYKKFGTLLLDDSNGIVVNVIIDKYRDPNRITTEIFEKWRKGAGLNPVTWRTLIDVLRKIELHELADEVTSILERHSQSFTPDNKPVLFRGTPVINEDLQHTTTDIDTLVSIATEIGAIDISNHLKQIVTDLRYGKLRIGVIGFQNAGKSTFLNALLGKKFLPSSVQAQTAKEIIIVHDPASPDGVLYSIKERGDKPTDKIFGRKHISDSISQLNKKQRRNVDNTSETSYEESEKLTYVLNAPIQFLKEHTDIKSLEISDTPGLGEAGCDSTEESKLAMKEMSAFILILNVQFLKTQAELDILHALLKHHPEIFENLNRILIVVNAYDVACLDTNPESLKPENIAQYVSDYLSQKEFLGTIIPSERIIPFSAKWALKARQWHSNPDIPPQDEDEMLSYKLALIILERAGYKEKIKESTKKNVEAIAEILETFSHIKDIEHKLVDMLLRNGPATLLKLAAIEDTLAEVKNMKLFIQGKNDGEKMKIESQSILLSKYEQIKEKFNEASDWHASNGILGVSSAIESHVDSVADSLRQAINGGMETKLNSHLSTFHKRENSEEVLKQIRSVRSPIESLAWEEMKSSWDSLSASIRSSQLEHTKIAVSQLRTELVSSLQSIANSAGEFPDLTAFISRISSQLSEAIDSIDTNSLIPGFGGMSVEISTSSISDENLNHISQISEQRFKNVQRSESTSCGFLWTGRCTRTWTESIPYYVTIFSPEISSLQDVFSRQAASPWVQSFRSNIDKLTAANSNRIIEAAKTKITSALSQAGQEIQRGMNDIKATLDTSKARIKKLNDNFKSAESVKNELKLQLKKD